MTGQISCITHFKKLNSNLPYPPRSETSQLWDHQYDEQCVDTICTQINEWHHRPEKAEDLKEYLYQLLCGQRHTQKSIGKAISFFLSQGALEDVQKSLSLYEHDPLYFQKNLTGEALHSLGDAQLMFRENDDLSCFDKACVFYFLAYQKGVKKSYIILLNFLLDEAFKNRPLIREYFTTDDAYELTKDKKTFAQELIGDFIYIKLKLKRLG